MSDRGSRNGRRGGAGFPFRDPRSDIRDSSAPWWLVPNLLALDAPCVAALWQRFLAAELGHAVPAAATACLFCAVWAMYLLDRFLDGRRGAIEAERHLVAAYHPQPYAVAASVVGLAGLTTALALPEETARRGMIATFAAGVYLILVHALGVRSWRGAKELAVAAGFAVGVTLAVEQSWAELAPVAATFGLLCWLNCRLIDRWEALTPRRIWPEWLLAAAVLAASVTQPAPIAAAVASAAVLLLVLDATCRRRARVGRALADAALLTPLFVWAVL